MKKILLSIFLVILLVSNAHGAISEDMSVYVRQDVLSERDRAFMAEIRLGFEQMRREMDKRFSEVDKRFDTLDKKIDNVKTELHQEMDKRFNEVDRRFNEMHSEIQTVDKKIDNVRTELKTEIQALNSKVDSLDDRTESTKTTVYWGLAFMGLILASAVVVPPLADFFKGLRKKEPSFTLEDVKKLIEENNAKILETINLKLA